jgi:hypothetical protein
VLNSTVYALAAVYLLQDAIVQYVMPFVTDNIGKNSTPEDWRLREAATFAFGSILEGPSPRSLAEIVRQAMGFLLAVCGSAACKLCRCRHQLQQFACCAHGRILIMQCALQAMDDSCLAGFCAFFE